MRVLDLFSGSKSLLKPTLEMGWEYFSIDNDPALLPDMVADVTKLSKKDIPFYPNIVWASPPCTSFSVASIGRHWNKDGSPKTDQARWGLHMVAATLHLIDDINPTFWFMENPRGMLRKMSIMQERIRHTVTYCQYGDTRMKPTDIWTNSIQWIPRPPCKNGDTCHVPAPRGSRTGTQGRANPYERARVPYELLAEILRSCVTPRKIPE